MAQGGPGYDSGDFMYPYGGEYGNEPNDMAYMNPPDMSSRGMNPPSMKYSRMTPPSYYYDNFPPYSDPVAPSNYYEDQFEPDDYQPHMWPEQEERRRKNPAGRGRRGMAYPSPDVHPEPIYSANQGMGDFSEDFSITSHEPNFDQVYQRNQQKWNKRGNSQQFDTGRFSQENMGPRGARPFSARGSSRGGVRGAMGGDSRGTGRGSQRGAGRGGTGRGSQRGAGRGAPRGAARGSPRGSSRGNTRAAQGGGVRGATRGRFNSNSGHFGHKMSAGPNYDQSSKKPWNQFGRKVAPIHSMARVVTTDPEIFTMAEKIRRFCLFLNSEPPKVNAIQTLQNALTGCKIGLKFDYQDEELMHVSNRWMFTGRLMLDEVFLARCVGPKKKEVKHECYNKALEVLKANTVAEILAKKDPGAETIREELKKKIEEKSENVGSLESLVLAKETADNITQQNQSPRTADFETLITYLQGNNPHPANCIARLEQAFVQSKCQLTHDCILESSHEPGTSRVMYRGSLKINGILIASEFGRRKKEAKLNTFTEALQALLTKPAAELMNGIPEKTLPGMDFSTPVVADSAESGMPLPKAPKKPPKEKDEPLKPLPVKIAEICGLMKKVMFTESFVNTLDTTALHLSLVPTCIFKRTASQEKEKGHMMICDLYLDDIMIATGEGYQRKDAQMDAYTNAYEVMTMYTPEYLVKNHKRLKPEDGEDPNVIEVNIKGTKKKEITDNIGTLKKFRLDYKDESKTLESMVILEHDDWSYDRRRQSFSILLYSCNQNGMLLEWTVEPEGSVFHKCTIKIQNEVVGEAVCQGKGNSKSLAAADALFRLYHRIPTVKVQKSDQPSISITFKEVEAKAEELKAKGEDEDTSSTTPTQISETNSSKPGSTQQDSSKPVVSPATSAASGKVDSGDVTVASDDKDSSDKKATERPANPWIVKAVRAFVEEFAKRKSIEEMSFGTGLSLSECRTVRSSARELGVQISFRVVEEELTLSVHCQLSPREIYNNLVKGDQQSGRYSLIPESELPPYSVVLEEKKKIESVQGLLLPRNEKK